MSDYLILKWLHIISSVFLTGVGFGSAFYLFFTHRSRNVAAIATVSRLVVKADWWFTTPTVIIQPATGIGLALTLGYSLTQPWLLLSLTLYFIAALCWLPVVWMQLKMRDMAAQAMRQQRPLAPQYWRYARYWTGLGCIAFPIMLIIYALMIFKPVL